MSRGQIHAQITQHITDILTNVHDDAAAEWMGRLLAATAAFKATHLERGYLAWKLRLEARQGSWTPWALVVLFTDHGDLNDTTRDLWATWYNELVSAMAYDAPDENGDPIIAHRES